MHQLLPPTYRDVWLEWRDSEQQKQEESRSAANKPRDQFISRLLTRLKQQQNQSHSQESRSQGQQEEGKAGEEEPEESWENLAGLDIGEGRQELEDKSGKRGGRKEGAGSLEASRELLKKLKKSQLAHKLQVDTLNCCQFYHLKQFILKDVKTEHVYFNNISPQGRTRAASGLPTPTSDPGSPAASPRGGRGRWDRQWEEYSDPSVHLGGAVNRRQRGTALQHRGDAAPQDFCHEPGLQGQPGAWLRGRSGVKG